MDFRRTTFALCNRASVCLSSVTFVRPAHVVELLGNILHRLTAQRHGQFVWKFWAEIREGSKKSCKLNIRGMKHWRFSTNISLYFENGTRYGHSYNGRRIGTRTQSIEWCHFQSPSMTPNLDFNYFQGRNILDVLENRVRVRSRSLEIAPFDRSHTSYIVTTALSCIICEI